jgi:hypothetical protein
MWIHHRLRSVLAFAVPLLFTREQPQGKQQPAPGVYLRIYLTKTACSEHSHDKYLRKVNDMLWIDNKINATDPVFGLLADSGAEFGKGNVPDATCLQVRFFRRLRLVATNADETNADGHSRRRIYKC